MDNYIFINILSSTRIIYINIFKLRNVNFFSAAVIKKYISVPDNKWILVVNSAMATIKKPVISLKDCSIGDSWKF